LLNLVDNQLGQITPTKKATPDQRLEILQLLAEALNNLEAAVMVNAPNLLLKQADSKHVIDEPDILGEYLDN